MTTPIDPHDPNAVWRLLTGNGKPSSGLIWKVDALQRDMRIIKRIGLAVLVFLAITIATNVADLFEISIPTARAATIDGGD